MRNTKSVMELTNKDTNKFQTLGIRKRVLLSVGPYSLFRELSLLGLTLCTEFIQSLNTL